MWKGADACCSWGTWLEFSELNSSVSVGEKYQLLIELTAIDIKIRIGIRIDNGFRFFPLLHRAFVKVTLCASSR